MLQFTSASWQFNTISADEILYRMQLRLCGMSDLDTEVWAQAFDCLARLRAQYPTGIVELPR